MTHNSDKCLHDFEGCPRAFFELNNRYKKIVRSFVKQINLINNREEFKFQLQHNRMAKAAEGSTELT